MEEHEKTAYIRLIKYRFRWNRNKTLRTAGFCILALGLLLFCGYPVMHFPLFAGVYALLEWADIRLNRKFAWLWTAVLYLSGALFSEKCIQHIILDAETYARTDRTEHLLNFMLILAFYLFLHAILARPRFVPAAAHLFCLIAGFADYFVYQFRQNEIVLSDLAAAGTGVTVLGSYTPSLHDRGAEAILLSILFFLSVWKLNVRFRKPALTRIAALAAGLLCLMTVLSKTKGYETQTWELKGSSQNGFVLNFVLSVRDSIILPPEGYSEETLAELEDAFGAADSGETRIVPSAENVDYPAIIVIMNESLADLSILGDFETNDEVLPFLSSLHDNTVRGYALSSVFGAKTPNSEWEFLSGGSMAFLPAGSVVYQQYLDEDPFTIVDTLKGLDYTAVAMHPYYSTGWSRNTVYPAMGFEETYFMDDGYFDENEILRKYITDQELYRKIIRRFEEKEDGERLFCMAVTMQNHGGYSDSYPGFTETVIAEPGIYDDVNQYLTLARISDNAIRELIRYFENVDEPVEIVIFGDHQPSLNAVFYQQLNGKGMNGLTMDELEDFYSVPFFIWTNYETDAVRLDRTSLNYLSTLTLQRAGIELPPCSRFLAKLMTEIPSINARGYYSRSRGCYLHIEDAEGEEAEWIAAYRILQYNMLFGGREQSRVFFPAGGESAGVTAGSE